MHPTTLPRAKLTFSAIKVSAAKNKLKKKNESLNQA